jgi:hypothetical protein
MDESVPKICIIAEFPLVLRHLHPLFNSGEYHGQVRISQSKR